jgi:hypothetical protein
MKKLILGMMILGSVSAFANVIEKNFLCEQVGTEKAIIVSYISAPSEGSFGQYLECKKNELNAMSFEGEEVIFAADKLTLNKHGVKIVIDTLTNNGEVSTSSSWNKLNCVETDLGSFNPYALCE